MQLHTKHRSRATSMRSMRRFLIGAVGWCIGSCLAASSANAAVAGAYAELPGVRLWYTDTGGDGEVLILLHANTGTSENWQPQNEAFAAAGYRVIAFDRRGWGKSIANPATGPQPGTVAEDLHSLVARLGIERFHLVGVAGGTFIALDYVAWQPERVLTLVAAASTGALTDAPEVAFRDRIAIPGIRELPAMYRELGSSYIGANPEGTKRWSEIEEHARQDDAPSQPLRTPNTYEKIAEIDTRVLVLAADADLLAPPGLMRQWSAHLQNGEWASVPDAGHSIAWEQPEIFNRSVLQFLKGCRGPSTRVLGADIQAEGTALLLCRVQ
jgi:pimeloyl-ACP methyl ester carboxylesterase